MTTTLGTGAGGGRHETETLPALKIGASSESGSLYVAWHAWLVQMESISDERSRGAIECMAVVCTNAAAWLLFLSLCCLRSRFFVHFTCSSKMLIVVLEARSRLESEAPCMARRRPWLRHHPHASWQIQGLLPLGSASNHSLRGTFFLSSCLLGHAQIGWAQRFLSGVSNHADVVPGTRPSLFCVVTCSSAPSSTSLGLIDKRVRRKEKNGQDLQGQR
jgi:hypothetical protein